LDYSFYIYSITESERLKHQNNPACTKSESIKNLHNAEVGFGHYTEEEEEVEEEEEEEVLLIT